MLVGKFKTLLKKNLHIKNSLVIAEAGINHNGSIKIAKKLIDAAKRSGADAIKFQTYITEKRVKKNSKIFNILKKCELKISDFKILKEYAEKKKIIFLSTPFDIESFNYLKKIGCKVFKIASFDISNTNFLKKIKIRNSTFIISTGMATINEIKRAKKILEKNKNEVIILHCISCYPNRDETSYLSNIADLKNKFKNNIIGFSDHTKDIHVALYGSITGAKIIEKHFMLNNQKCIDAPVSLNEKQMLNMNLELKRISKIFGKPKFGIRPEEKSIKIYKNKS